MKHFILALLLLIAPLAYSKTVSSVAIAPQGAVIKAGSTLSFSATCTYSDASTDNCAAAGGVTWSSSKATAITVNSSGVAAAADPGAGKTAVGYVIASAGGITDRAGVYSQHPGDTFYQYITPDYRIYKTTVESTTSALPLNVVVGSTVTIGSGIVINYNAATTGMPFQSTCNWTSSDPTKATVDRMGLVTAISPGPVTITCGRAGTGVFGSSTTSGWVSPGNVISLTVVAGGTGNQTWYVRPGGGTPFVDAKTTPAGQCDGKHDADYPGSGVNQPCAFGNIRYLWADGTTYQHLGWVISGGDTVIVRQNPKGYNAGQDAAGNGVPMNCSGSASGCYMPTIPSGTAARHTRILGENYANCAADSAKTLLHGTWGDSTVFNTKDSQFVDIACFEVTDQAACAGSGAFTNTCRNGSYNSAAYGILQSALTASVNYTDLFIHGLADEAIHGATGVGVVGERIHVRGMPDAGIDMDDAPWQSPNISVAGGFTLKDSMTEFTGCVEEYPVVHNYPYIECRDQSLGGYGDGFGTASATGDWLFDHDTWRYNFQDGLDLLHSGMHSLTITNSTSYGNDGQQFKIGSGLIVKFENNITLHNCARIAQAIGDEPSSAIIPGVSTCRAAGDGIPIAFDGQGTDIFQNNTYVGYGATSYDLQCVNGWDSCANTKSVFENNINIGITNTNYNGGVAPGLFYDEQSSMPANGGWAVRDHNLYYGFRNGGCPTLNAGEICADAKFVGEPALKISSETTLDNFNFALSSTSPAKGTGLIIPGLVSDILGLTRLDPPSMGAIEFGGSSTAPSLQPATITVSTTPSTVVAGQSVTVSASVAPVGSVVPTGTVSFENGTSSLGTAPLSSSGVATLPLSSLAAGTYSVTASYSGDSSFAAGVSSPVSLTVQSSSTSTGTTTPPSGTTSSSGTTSPPGTGPSTGTTTSPTGGTTSSSGSTTTPPAGTNSGSGDTTSTGTTPPPTSTPKPSNVSVTIGQPDYGFNVIPGSTRRVFATVANGTTNQVVWTVKSGSAQLSSKSGSWVDVTAPASGSACSYTGTSAKYGVSSATQFTIEATSADDTTKTALATFNVCKPAVEVSLVPFYRTLYANQPADVQSLVLGSVNQNVHWAITSQPKGGDGKLTDSTSRDTLFTGTVAGRYELTATSVADSGKSATAIMYVTGHKMPYRVTPNQTEPVDCTVDPAMQGTVYEVGPSKEFKTLASVPFPTMAPGSTVRVHNEDTTGLHPTEYHEYVQISQPATAEQPIRICGVPDATGHLPIIDGSKATGRSDASKDVAGYGLLTLHNTNSFAYWPKFVAAQYIAVEGIQFRDANPAKVYTSPTGASENWQKTAACIHVTEAQNVAFVGNDIGSCASGVVTDFNSNGGWGSSDLNLLWEGNHIHNNGVAGSNADHQMYLQSWNNVIQFNRIDNYTAGALGANIKSRGLQDVIRYNYLGDGAQREMDLVDVKDAPAYMSFDGFLSGGADSFHALYSKDNYPADQIAAEQEAWNSHFVYGNIYQNSTSAAPIHFSMDTTGGELARKGSLYWYNNTFYEKACSTCSNSLWTLFDTTGGNGTYYPQTEFQTVQAYNDLIWMDNTSKPSFQWNNYSAFIGLGAGNMMPSKWGSNLMTGGAGSGWNTSATTEAYQNSLPLDLHVTGFDNKDLITSSSTPFDRSSWTLPRQITATQSVPSAVCEMPTRFAYLPNLGYAVPRATTLNVGATDTVAETASLINEAAGSGRYNTRYSNCH